MMLITLTDPVWSWEHVITAFAGATAMGMLAHAVNTFPTPTNIYGQWLLGVIKFAVGQRISAMNALQGMDTMAVAVPRGSVPGLTKATSSDASHTEVTPEAIKVVNEHVAKTETTIPNPGPPKAE